MDWFKKYLLSSVAFAPADAPAGGTPDEEAGEVDQADDELVLDPVDEAQDGDDAETPDNETDPDDDAGDGADGEEELAAGAGARQPSRAERRIQALNTERTRLAEENARITRELAEARNQRPQAPVETSAQRAERLALLSPEDRSQVMVTEALAEHDRKSNMLTFQLLDQSDRTSFETRVATNPVYKKLAPEVETKLQQIRAQGGNSPRDAILTYLLGERARKQLENPQRKNGAQQRQQQQRARPVNARGDVQPERRPRGNDLAAMEKRLENQQI